MESSDAGFFAPPLAPVEPARYEGVTHDLDFRQVHRATRWRATPTAFGPVVRLLLTAPFLLYSLDLFTALGSGRYRAFSVTYAVLCLGASLLWARAVWSRSRHAPGEQAVARWRWRWLSGICVADASNGGHNSRHDAVDAVSKRTTCDERLLPCLP